MNNFPSESEINYIRQKYPAGTKIRLVFMNDSISPVQPGTTGTVTEVDDAGNIHIHWENSRSLALIEGVDVFEVISDV